MILTIWSKYKPLIWERTAVREEKKGKSVFQEVLMGMLSPTSRVTLCLGKYLCPESCLLCWLVPDPRKSTLAQLSVWLNSEHLLMLLSICYTLKWLLIPSASGKVSLLLLRSAVWECLKEPGLRKLSGPGAPSSMWLQHHQVTYTSL